MDHGAAAASCLFCSAGVLALIWSAADPNGVPCVGESVAFGLSTGVRFSVVESKAAGRAR